MRLHVLTAVSRPENLPEIAWSIMEAAKKAPTVDWIWHQRLDRERRWVGGQRLKNEMLNDITDGWVCILDDDTVMHPDFLRRVSFVLATQPLVERECRAIIVSQKRTTGVIMRASPENAVVGKIDAGQAVLRRDLIGDTRIPETYAGDGAWLETLLTGRNDVHYMRDVLSLHNALSGVDVSETPERMQA
jgi:hypothetical protein